MMDKLFGTKKKEEKKPEKKLHELSDEELKETQRNFKKKLMQEQREIDRMIMSLNKRKNFFLLEEIFIFHFNKSLQIWK